MKVVNEGETYCLFELHQRGLISSKTLMDEFGLDPEKEMKLMQEDQKRCSSVASTKGRIPKDEVDINTNRVEQGRRNLEALTKFVGLMHSDMSAAQKLVDFERIQEVAKASFNAMGDVSKL